MRIFELAFAFVVAGIRSGTVNRLFSPRCSVRVSLKRTSAVSGTVALISALLRNSVGAGRSPGLDQYAVYMPA